MYGHHIDEMVEKLRDRGLITESEKPEARDALAACWTEKIANVWMLDDVLAVDPTLPKSQALTVLHKLQENFNSEIGINWMVIEATIQEVKDRENVEKHLFS